MDIKISIQELTQAFDTGENLAERLSKEESDALASEAIEGYYSDDRSRTEWKKKNEQAMKLALQVSEVKNFPHEMASNVKFPAITIPSLQFAARAYPTLVESPGIVKCRVIGEDLSGEKQARASRVSTHMSWQMLEQDEGWERGMDSLLITLPITGCSFKKTYFDTARGYTVSEHVLAENLVTNYWTKTLETSPRYSHRFSLDPNVIEERMRMEIYSRHDLSHAASAVTSESDKREGLTPSHDIVFDEVIEQYVLLDLDADGYKEPYTLTVHVNGSKLLRLIPRFSAETVLMMKGKVAKITASHHFTKYTFIPAPDGGFYDIGFGQLLAPLNESINTNINLLTDAGKLATMGGGFVGRGARMKKGEYLFKLGEWKEANVSGDDLRKAIFPLPRPEPSQVLFQLLTLMIDYTERISSVADMNVGKTPGQNTPATTSMAVLEQGGKLFTAIYKRCYRSLKDEIRIRYRLNGLYLNEEEEFQVVDANLPAKALREDYLGDATDIVPNADPNIASDSLRKSMAMELKAAAGSSPYYNNFAIEKRFAKALGVTNIAEILPEDENGGPINQPQPDPKIEIDKQKVRATMMDIVGRLGLYEAQVEEIYSKAILNIAKAESEEEGQQMAQYTSILGGIREMREIAKQAVEKRNEQTGLPGMAGPDGNEGAQPILP